MGLPPRAHPGQLGFPCSQLVFKKSKPLASEPSLEGIVNCLQPRLYFPGSQLRFQGKDFMLDFARLPVGIKLAASAHAGGKPRSPKARIHGKGGEDGGQARIQGDRAPGKLKFPPARTQRCPDGRRFVEVWSERSSAISSALVILSSLVLAFLTELFTIPPPGRGLRFVTKSGIAVVVAMATLSIAPVLPRALHKFGNPFLDGQLPLRRASTRRCLLAAKQSLGGVREISRRQNHRGNCHHT